MVKKYKKVSDFVTNSVHLSSKEEVNSGGYTETRSVEAYI